MTETGKELFVPGHPRGRKQEGGSVPSYYSAVQSPGTSGHDPEHMSSAGAGPGLRGGLWMGGGRLP